MNESPKRSPVDRLNRVEYHLRQLRKNSDNGDVWALTDAIDTVRNILRTFRKHHSRRSNKPQYAKPAESSFRARTIQYAASNIAPRQNGVKRAA